jgi:transposase
MRYMLSDEVWSIMEPLVREARVYKQGCHAQLPERMFFEAILYVCRTGISWRDLPSEFGSWHSVYGRFRRWVYSGSLKNLFTLMTQTETLDSTRELFMDGTIVRAHVSAAGARKSTGKGKNKPETNATDTPKDDVPNDQGLGRSRGGFTSKILITAADESTAIDVKVVPGQDHEAPHFDSMLDDSLPRTQVIDEVIADSAYDSDAIRNKALDNDIMPQIPSKQNRKEAWPLDTGSYRRRNKVERLIGKLKQFRRVATRYDKTRRMFLGFIHLALGFIARRHQPIANTA